MHFRIAPMTNPQSLEKNPKFWALIPCGGNGSRAQSEIPKQYRVIAGKPMVMHTLAAFEQVKRLNVDLSGGLVVIAKDDDQMSELLKKSENTIFSIAPQAGNTRATTVFNGLNALTQQGAVATDWVLVHDAARCLITSEQINALIDACKDDAVGGLLALPLPDTLKSEHSGRVTETLGRNDKWLAQTPQMFRIGQLIAAIQAAKEGHTEITDESSAMEHMGLQPKLVRGSTQNFKVTYPEDFDLAEALLQIRIHQS
jgi:2-C-methyl-D-erythritol 4-phosphate cytidylyltransferase